MVKTILIPTDVPIMARRPSIMAFIYRKKTCCATHRTHVGRCGADADRCSATFPVPLACPPTRISSCHRSRSERKGGSNLKSLPERCERWSCSEARKAIVSLTNIIEEGKKTDWILLAQRGEHFSSYQGQYPGSTAAGRGASQETVMVLPPLSDIESMALPMTARHRRQRLKPRCQPLRKSRLAPHGLSAFTGGSGCCRLTP